MNTLAEAAVQNTKLSTERPRFSFGKECRHRADRYPFARQKP
jgi:hypothetical protein